MEAVVRGCVGIKAVKTIPGAAGALILAAGLAACALFSTSEKVEVLFPVGEIQALGGEAPEGWDVYWAGESLKVGYRFAPAGTTLILLLPREYPVILAAFPRTGEEPAFTLKPAGCVMGLNEPDRLEGRARSSWVDGFTADFLVGMAGKGLDPAVLNVVRFRDAARKRSSGSSPWHLDARSLAGDVCSGNLRYYSFRLRPLHTVHLELPPGCWYPSYPPGEVLEAGAGGWNGSLREGLHRFRRLSDGMSAAVSVDGSGAVVLELLPGENHP